MADTQFPGQLFPNVGFQVSYPSGNSNTYTSYDTYGFDQYEWAIGIRIKYLTGINPTRDDADYCLTIIADNDMDLASQNAAIITYMTNIYGAENINLNTHVSILD
jgi:hypothetical protein